MENLSFITDKTLQKTIKNSIEYTYILSEKSKIEGETDLFKEETYRVIVLYIVSIIEAVLLYLFKTRGDKITYLEYKYVTTLPEEFNHKNNKDGHVIVAVQKAVSKSEHQIGLFELVNFFKDKNFIKQETADSILEINDIRNTLHFSKPRHAIPCRLEEVEQAFELLVKVLEKAPKIPLRK